MGDLQNLDIEGLEPQELLLLEWRCLHDVLTFACVELVGWKRDMGARSVHDDEVPRIGVQVADGYPDPGQCCSELGGGWLKPEPLTCPVRHLSLIHISEPT